MSEKTRSRIRLLSVEEARAAARQVEVPEPMAELNIFRVLLHQPQLAKNVNDLLLTLIFRSKLDHRLRELVIMRLGWATGSDYEWTQHWRLAQEQFKMSPEDLLAVRDWQRSERFGPAERAVLAATDEMLESGKISAATWELCRKHVGGELELLELTASIGCWHMISQLARSIEIPLEAGIESWPPDGTPPRGE